MPATGAGTGATFFQKASKRVNGASGILAAGLAIEQLFFWQNSTHHPQPSTMQATSCGFLSADPARAEGKNAGNSAQGKARFVLPFFPCEHNWPPALKNAERKKPPTRLIPAFAAGRAKQIAERADFAQQSLLRFFCGAGPVLQQNKLRGCFERNFFFFCAA